MNKLKRDSCVRLSVFNHKGGVGKTTLTINIGAALAELGYRVLLVDADPQCNLSAALLEQEIVDDYLDNSDGKNGQTIWSAVKPITEATGAFKVVKPVELPITNLFLIPGDIRLSQFELDLNDFWFECLQRKSRGFRGTTAISDLISMLTNEYKFDYVLYDTGPNIGPLSRTVLLDCDFFIIPMACDLFSLRALTTLGRTIFDWIRSWDTIAKLAPTGTVLLKGRPAFLGYIPQRFRIYGGKPAANQSKFISRMEKEIFGQIVNVLKELDATSDSLKRKSYKLGELQDFGSLIGASQQQGRPIWQADAGTSAQRDSAKKSINAIARTIVTATTSENL